MELNCGLWFSHGYFIFMSTYHCIPLLKENPLNNYFNWNSLISQSIYQPVRYSCWPIILNHLLQPWIRFTLDHTIILSVINLPTNQVLMYTSLLSSHHHGNRFSFPSLLRLMEPVGVNNTGRVTHRGGTTSSHDTRAALSLRLQINVQNAVIESSVWALVCKVTFEPA